jgi:hypothetical protein
MPNQHGLLENVAGPKIMGNEVVSPFSFTDLFEKNNLLKATDDSSELIYSTFLGGTAADWWSNIDVDQAGCAYIGGVTDSPDFPVTTGVFDVSYNGSSDAYIAKLNADGTDLVYATFIGGSGMEVTLDLDVDEYGSVNMVLCILQVVLHPLIFQLPSVHLTQPIMVVLMTVSLQK